MLPSDMYAKYTQELLVQLCEIWPNPKTGLPGLNPSELAVLAGFKTRQTVYNYFDGRTPDDEAKNMLGKFFGLYFVNDWDNHLDNSKVLALKKEFLEKYVYKQSINV